MARPCQEAIDTFMSITGVTEAVAVQKLELGPGVHLKSLITYCSFVKQCLKSAQQTPPVTISGKSMPPTQDPPPGGACLPHKVHLQEERALLHNDHLQEGKASSTISTSRRRRPPLQYSPPGGARLLHKIYLQKEQGLFHEVHLQEEKASSTMLTSHRSKTSSTILIPRRNKPSSTILTSGRSEASSMIVTSGGVRLPPQTLPSPK
ncbi:hypothetical protein RHMOL_Rhmol11G0050100 [Rhododendron molle]|uniref:Uncharacterized protein n=1 Tax=Rhododendron molle TaxID=49168 RepID=A0ACC0LNH8_RHOML|nr:hypothetical protein RHMOL_Rhmol11G0050100 [Rhododendron molle]